MSTQLELTPLLHKPELEAVFRGGDYILSVANTDGHIELGAYKSRNLRALASILRSDLPSWQPRAAYLLIWGFEQG
jgi:hypothetical protein